MPPLPVSKIKLSVSGKFSNVTLIITIPPDNKVKGKRVIKVDEYFFGTFCPFANVQPSRINKIAKRKICLQAAEILIGNRCVTHLYV